MGAIFKLKSPTARLLLPRACRMIQTIIFKPMAALDDNLRDWIKADLAEIAGTFMPFGKFGPAHHPPHGVPLFDLPLEYLCCFERRGWPRGRIGELLRIVHQLKADGCDEIFDRFRLARGGRTSLRGR